MRITHKEFNKIKKIFINISLSLISSLILMLSEGREEPFLVNLIHNIGKHQWRSSLFIFLLGFYFKLSSFDCTFKICKKEIKLVKGTIIFVIHSFFSKIDKLFSFYC